MIFMFEEKDAAIPLTFRELEKFSLTVKEEYFPLHFFNELLKFLSS